MEDEIKSEGLFEILLPLLTHFYSEILEARVLPFLQGRPDRHNIIFQQDGARLAWPHLWSTALHNQQNKDFS